MSAVRTRKINMSTGKNHEELDQCLQAIPTSFRNRIIKEYVRIKTRFRKGEFDSSGLSCGKFCEEVLRFLQQHLTGSHIGFTDEIKNFHHKVGELEKVDKSIGNDSLRIIIPRSLAFLYTMRNKRNIGHSGGDVEANEIDAHMISKVSDWVVCELIRIFYRSSLEEAQQIVDVIATRNLPEVWEINGKKRVLLDNVSARDKVLILTYSQESKGVFFEDLLDWVEYSNVSVFKRKVLGPLHTKNLVEYDQELNMVFISPKGIKEVEDSFFNQIVN